NGANSRWEAMSTPSSYLTVSSTVSTIWIAYSEERWPSHMLELLENHVNLREKVMLKVDLTPEETPHSFKLDKLPQNVAEFMPSASRNPAANQMRYTQLQAEDAGRLDYMCDRNRETARAIVLRDGLGELLDVGALHVQLAATIQRFAQEHYYATSMADCVDMIRKRIDKSQDHWSKLLSTHPLNPEFDTLRQDIAREMAAQERKSSRLIGLMANLFALSDSSGGTARFSPLAEIEVALNGISSITDEKKAEAWAYCWFLLGRSWQYTAITETGNRVMGDVIEGKGEGNTNEWHKVMHSLLDASNKGTHAFEIRNLRHFNFAVSSQAYVMAQRWTRSEAGLIHLKSFAKPLGRGVRLGQVPADDVAGVIRQQFISMNIPVRGGSFNSSTRQFSSARTNLLNVPRITGDVSVNMTSGGASYFQNLHDADSVLKGAGLLLGLATAYSALTQLSEPSGLNATTMGSVANNAKIAVISEIVGLAAAITDVRTISSAANFGTIRADAMRSLFQNGTRFNLGTIRVLNLTTASNGMAANLAKYATFANAALAVGAAIAIGKSYEGFVRGDYTAAIGNALVAAGSIIMIATMSTGVGAVIGLVMIAVGTVITIFSDDDLTKWLRGSFWGVGYYVYWDRARPQVFDQQLEISTRLADQYPQISEYYKKELEDFLDLVWGVSITNSTKGDKQAEIFCSAIQSEQDVAKLSVALKQISQTSSFMGMPGPRVAIDVKGVTVDLQFVEPQRVRAIFRNFEPREQSTYIGGVSYSTVDIEASYPNFGGGTWTGLLTIDGHDL
ncbi:MAG: toxin VasX, partial [Vibrio fluvialis]